jgi:hypothetical protein
MKISSGKMMMETVSFLQQVTVREKKKDSYFGTETTLFI